MLTPETQGKVEITEVERGHMSDAITQIREVEHKGSKITMSRRDPFGFWSIEIDGVEVEDQTWTTAEKAYEYAQTVVNARIEQEAKDKAEAEKAAKDMAARVAKVEKLVKAENELQIKAK